MNLTTTHINQQNLVKQTIILKSTLDQPNFAIPVHVIYNNGVLHRENRQHVEVTTLTVASASAVLILPMTAKSPHPYAMKGY